MNNPARAGAAAHAMVADVAGATIALSDATHRHFLRVLRLRAGEAVTVTDGRGSWRPTAVPGTFSTHACLEPTGDITILERPAIKISFGIALPKGDKPEFVVQKLTELGVDEILFFHGDRSVAHWNEEKVRRNIERLRAVAVEALQQSRGAFMPTVGWIPDLAAHIGGVDTATAVPGAQRVFRTDVTGVSLALGASQLLLVGPEGGWSPRETELGEAVGLGDLILRAETAAVVGAALAVSLRSGLVCPGGR